MKPSHFASLERKKFTTIILFFTFFLLPPTLSRWFETGIKNFSPTYFISKFILFILSQSTINQLLHHNQHCKYHTLFLLILSIYWNNCKWSEDWMHLCSKDRDLNLSKFTQSNIEKYLRTFYDPLLKNLETYLTHVALLINFRRSPNLIMDDDEHGSRKRIRGNHQPSNPLESSSNSLPNEGNTDEVTVRNTSSSPMQHHGNNNGVRVPLPARRHFRRLAILDGSNHSDGVMPETSLNQQRVSLFFNVQVHVICSHYIIKIINIMEK